MRRLLDYSERGCSFLTAVAGIAIVGWQRLAFIICAHVAVGILSGTIIRRRIATLVRGIHVYSGSAVYREVVDTIIHGFTHEVWTVCIAGTDSKISIRGRGLSLIGPVGAIGFVLAVVYVGTTCLCLHFRCCVNLESCCRKEKQAQDYLFHKRGI